MLSFTGRRIHRQAGSLAGCLRPQRNYMRRRFTSSFYNDVQKHKERQTDKQTDRQTDRDMDRYRDRRRSDLMARIMRKGRPRSVSL